MPHEELKRSQPNYFFEANHMQIILKERDHAVAELVVRQESCNPYGRVHGGALYTLGDSAAGNAVHTDGRFYVTQHSSVHYLRNVTEGHTVRAEARVRHRGRATCLCEVTLTDEENHLLATGDYTFFCVNENKAGISGNPLDK